MIRFAALLALISPLLAAPALAGDFKPRSPQDVVGTDALPERPTCADGSAFGVTPGSPAAQASVKIVDRRVHWAGDTAVTEYTPPAPSAPFSRYFYMETPTSHLVSWSMAMAFYDSEVSAEAAATRLGAWYAKSLGLPFKPGAASGLVMLRPAKGYTLMVMASGATVQVSCMHDATSSKAMLE